MLMRKSNRPTNSSRTKTAPAIGALNAVARPAPAPAARSALHSTWLRRNTLPTNSERLAPICTVGPSRPSARPVPKASKPPRNLTTMMRKGLPDDLPSNAASICGMPLPVASGENRRTNQAASPVAEADIPMIRRNPTNRSPCAQIRTEFRNRSPRSSITRKTAASTPDAVPAMSDRSASATWLSRLFEESAASSGSWSMNRWRECSRREEERLLSKIPAGLA